jgi:hypothetical protein
MTAAEPGSSEADFRAAVVAAPHGPRLRPFDAAAHERDKRNAAHLRGVAAGHQFPEPSGSAPEASVSPLFNGLNRATSVNNGFVFFPPDTHLAKSPNRAVEVVNSAIRLFTNAGGVLGTSNLNTFFGAAVANGLLFDPKVIYDHNAVNRRYYVVALQKKGDNDSTASNDLSRIWIAVSRTPDPTNLTTNWCKYQVDGRRDVGTASVNWADYPGLGNGFDSLIISTNQFRFTSPRPFIRSQIKAFRKLVAANNAASCPAIPYFTWNNAVGSVDAFTLQPVQHYTAPSSFAGTAHPAYLVSNRATSPNNSSRLWRVRNVSGAPTLHATFFAAPVSTSPPDAPQPGGGALIDTGDVRNLAASGVGNYLSVAHATGCQQGVGANEACTSFRRLVVSQSGAGLPTVGVSQTLHGYGYGDNSYSFWPSIATLTNHTAMMTMQVIDFSPVVRLSTFVNAKLAGGAWYVGFNVAPGTCNQTLSNRSGDYTAAVRDPGGASFWFAGEHAIPIAGSCQWSTRWGRLLVP